MSESGEPRRGRMRFRGAHAPVIDSDCARRQNEITRTACLLLGRERAIEFLDSENPDLGARPLDLATASAEGRDSVELALGRLVFLPLGERSL